MKKTVIVMETLDNTMSDWMRENGHGRMYHFPTFYKKVGNAKKAIAKMFSDEPDTESATFFILPNPRTGWYQVSFQFDAR